MKTPTDLQILEYIYKKYCSEYLEFSKEIKNRETKNFVAIDFTEIGKALKVESNLIFGRLYYHLNHVYGYKNEDNSKVLLFSRVGVNGRHCINFPYLASVVANLRYERKKFKTATALSWFALGIAVGSAIISFFSLLSELP